ncbi:MAG: ABC transporter permease subunit [candidate division Zixibacteria bacterium]|nr:ABC transporter permease subunit [candidate division Zixibacteria bacterium]
MTKFLAILYDSFLEIRNGKILYLYGCVVLFLLMLFTLIPNVNIMGEDVLNSDFLTPDLVAKVNGYFFDGYWGFVMFLMVFGTAWLLPSYLSRGRIELALSKPIDRFSLLSMKFLSVYLIMLSILTVMSVPIWLILSLRLGVFAWSFFYSLFFSYVIFLCVFAIVFFFGVLSRSGALAVMGYFVISVVGSILTGREAVYGFLGETVWTTILDTIYYILPKLGEMSDNYTALIAGDGLINGFAIWTSLAFTAVIYLLTLLVFNRRDY